VVPAEAREVGELESSRVDIEALPSSPPVGMQHQAFELLSCHQQNAILTQI